MLLTHLKVSTLAVDTSKSVNIINTDDDNNVSGESMNFIDITQVDCTFKQSLYKFRLNTNCLLSFKVSQYIA